MASSGGTELSWFDDVAISLEVQKRDAADTGERLTFEELVAAGVIDPEQQNGPEGPLSRDCPPEARLVTVPLGGLHVLRKLLLRLSDLLLQAVPVAVKRSAPRPLDVSGLPCHLKPPASRTVTTGVSHV